MPTPKKHQSNAAKQRAYRSRQAEAREAELSAKGLPSAASIPTMPSERRWSAQVQLAQTIIANAQDEMQTYYNSLSEAWQESERCTDFQARVDSIDAVLEKLDEVQF